jgi:hypothetical protein
MGCNSGSARLPLAFTAKRIGRLKPNSSLLQTAIQEAARDAYFEIVLRVAYPKGLFFFLKSIVGQKTYQIWAYPFLKFELSPPVGKLTLRNLFIVTR